jgi:hypothetical protein
MLSSVEKDSCLNNPIPFLSVRIVLLIVLFAFLFHTGSLAQVSIVIGPETKVEANNVQIYLSGNWTNDGTFTSGTSTLVFDGTVAQAIGGRTVPSAFNSLTVNNDKGVTLDVPVTVDGVLTLTTGLLTAASPNAITFGVAVLNPTESHLSRIVGMAVMSARTVGTGSLSFLGIHIAAGSDDVGDVSVTRVTGSDGIIKVGSNSGIACNWDIGVGSQPASGRNVTFSWLSDLDNEEDMSAATVYREDAGGWAQVGDVTDASSSDPRIVTVNGVTHFSRWTVSGSSIPLPIQLASFSVSVIRDKDVEVTWKTASETNSYGFEVCRRYRGTKSSNGQLHAHVTTLVDTAWTEVGCVSGHGTTLQPQSYSLLDAPTRAGYYEYRLKQIDLDGKSAIFGTVEVEVGLPKNTTLYQNYPNPFNPTTTIGYALPKQSYVTLRIYDMLGRVVQTLADETQDAGLYEVNLNASGLASGVYFYRLQAGNFNQTRKLLLLR